MQMDVEFQILDVQERYRTLEMYKLEVDALLKTMEFSELRRWGGVVFCMVFKRDFIYGYVHFRICLLCASP